MGRLSEHDAIGELIELAGVYFADGAHRTAAARLRQAAERCDRIADAMDSYFTSSQAPSRHE